MRPTIGVLHNPDASFSSKDPPHWQVVVVPQRVMSDRISSTFVPLNSTEIALLGGRDDSGYFGDVFIFNTSTNEISKREVEEGGLSFNSNIG